MSNQCVWWTLNIWHHNQCTIQTNFSFFFFFYLCVCCWQWFWKWLWSWTKNSNKLWKKLDMYLKRKIKKRIRTSIIYSCPAQCQRHSLTISPMSPLMTVRWLSHVWVLSLHTRPRDFHFCVPCLSVTSNTSPGHRRANPWIPAEPMPTLTNNAHLGCSHNSGTTTCTSMAFSAFPMF